MTQSKFMKIQAKQKGQKIQLIFFFFLNSSITFAM